ncbi:MAG TPA: SufS family cysteine desulfurase [Thermoleophilaceae bacterium]|nr:SufS family cysteine desulfurase [Thermoleophilaceae bacterium]
MTTLAPAALDFPILQQEFDEGRLVYLDSAATSQKPAAVLDAMDAAYRTRHASIHRGVYPLAARSTEDFEAARDTVARWIGAASSREVVFTGNASAALNIAARGLAGPGDTVLLTEMEHHSNIVPWQLAGARIEPVRVTGDGTLDLDDLDRLLARGAKAVGVVHVSNVLGTVNPIAEIARRAHEAGALVVVDGAQAAPHMALDMADTGADLYAFTAHKMYGPTGIGVLWGRREILERIEPLHGGGHMISRVDWEGSRWNELPWKFEAGTSPIVEAIGLAAAIDWLGGIGMDSLREHEADLTAYALDRLAEVPGLTVHGPPAEARGSLASFAIEGAHPHDIAEILGRRNVCVRAGHHCAQPLMRRLGVPATARASFAVHNTRADVDSLIDGLHEVRSVLEL